MTHTPTLSYKDLLNAKPLALLQALSDRLPLLWDQVAEQRAYEELGDSGYDPCIQRQREISHLIGQLKRVHADIGQLRSYLHDWSDDDYCLICGADGRG